MRHHMGISLYSILGMAGIIAVCFNTSPANAQCVSTASGTYQLPSYLLSNEFASTPGSAGFISPACLRDLVASTANIYPDTSQRMSIEGSANGSAVGAFLSLTAPLGATILTPASSVAAVVTAAAAGTTFYFTPGLYRGVAISPKAGDVFIGAGNVVLNGSTLLTTWTGSAGNYSATAPQGVSPANGGGTCASGFSRCTYPYDVFYDGVPLLAVATLGALATGDFYYDLTAGVIHIFDNPTGHTLETSTTPVAFGNAASNVVIRNLIVTKYDSAFQQAAIGNNAQTVTGWTIDHVESSLNHGYGIALPGTSTLSASWVHDNGEMGVGAGSSSGQVVNGNEMAYNNYAGYDCNNECGGLKFGQVNNSNVIFNNSHNNLGFLAFGLWYDEDSVNGNVSYNRTHDNGGGGISLEISCQMWVTHNTLYNDGYNGNTGLWNGEVQFAATHDVDISYNVMAGLTGPIGPQQSRGSGTNCGSHVISNAKVHDNDVTVPSATTGGIGLWTDDGATIFVASNAFTNNRYHTDNSSGFIFYWSAGGVQFPTWQGYPQDATGTINTSPVPDSP